MLKALGMHWLINKQSEDVTLEYIENPMNTIDITSKTMITWRKYKKYRGTPGPKNESWLVSMLQEV
jgi:hypothetical protein